MELAFTFDICSASVLVTLGSKSGMVYFMFFRSAICCPHWIIPRPTSIYCCMLWATHEISGPLIKLVPFSSQGIPQSPCAWAEYHVQRYTLGYYACVAYKTTWRDVALKHHLSLFLITRQPFPYIWSCWQTFCRMLISGRVTREQIKWLQGPHSVFRPGSGHPWFKYQV